MYVYVYDVCVCVVKIKPIHSSKCIACGYTHRVSQAG